MKYNHLTKEELVNKISELEARLAKTQWLHQSENPEKKQYTPLYGDVTELNTDRTILDTVGKDTLKTMTSELMDLLDTSVAIYEKNGDYAYGVFNSGWCQLLDASSRKLCNTDDNKTALRCGKWLCHDDCRNNSAKAAILARKSSDIDCIGAIKLYAEPIFVGDHVIGAINIGYGNPPIDDETLQELSEKFGIDFETLKQNALSYKHRPDFIIEIAKKRLKSIAKLIGEIVSAKLAELELKENEKKFRLLANNTADGLVIINNKGKIEYVSPSYLHLLGYSKADVLQRDEQDIAKVIHPDDRENTISSIYNAIREKKETFSYVYRAKHKNGHYIWRRDNARFIYDRNGNYLKSYVVCRDITDRQNAELKLRESEEKYRQLFEFMPIGVTVSDNAGKVIESNKIAERLLGITKDEHLKRTIDGEEWKIIRTDGSLMPACEYASVKALKEQKLIENVEMGICKSDKDITWISVSAVPRNDRSGVIITYSDITKKRKAEKALKESERKYRTLFENSLATITFFDDDFKLAMLNEANANLLGGKKEDFIGKSIYELFPDVADFHVERLKKIISSGKAEIFEDAFNFPNGTKWFSSLLQPIYDTNQQFEGIQIISIEITEKKQAEQALKENQKLLHSVINNSNSVIYAKDYKGRFILVNKEFEKAFLPADEVLGKTDYDFMPKARADKYRDNDLQILKTGEALQFEETATLSDGRHTVVSNKFPLYDYKGKIIGVGGISTDITDRKHAEQALKESEAKYKALFSASPDAILLANRNTGIIVNANKESEKLFETTLDNIIGLHQSQLHPEQQSEKAKMAFKNKPLKEDEQTNPVEINIVTAHNTIKNVEIRGQLLKFNDEEFVLGTFRDITDRKKAQENLLKNKTILEEAEKLSNIGSFEWDITKNELTLSKGWQKIHGVNKDILNIEELMPIAHKTDRERIEKAFDKALSNIAPYNLEHRIVRQTDNEIRTIKTRGKVIFDENDMPIRMYGFVEDITDRKQAEQALKESEAKYKILFEQSTVGLAVTDARGNIINANEKLCQMLNYSKEELLTKKVNEISHPDDMAKESELAKDVLAGEKCDIVLEKRYITKDNRIVWGFLHTRVIRGGDKNIDYIIAAVTDITELKQAEEKLQEYAIELEKANVTKDRFISILGHDLRTPFNSIMGFSDLLLRNIERYDKEKIKQFVNNISKMTNQTFNLLENLLEWSRCQRDKIPFNPQFVDVFNLVYEPYGIVLGSAEAKQIAIDIDVPATIKVFADIEMIKTVIRNLLSNAIKFTPENGEINISAKALTRAVQISVSDTGTGMNEKIKNSLFKIGETVTVEGTNGERGSGLGLLLCKEFVEKHGGEIRVESREGKGSEFAFTLPLHSIP